MISWYCLNIKLKIKIPNSQLLYWYIPTHSQHFTKIEFTKISDFLVKKEIDPELMTLEGKPERGISDAAINNQKYTALLAYYRLDNYSNFEIKETNFIHFAKSVMQSKDRIPNSIVKEPSASTKAIPYEKSRDQEERSSLFGGFIDILSNQFEQPCSSEKKKQTKFFQSTGV